MALPLPLQRLVIESSYSSKALWPGDENNFFPDFVALQKLSRKFS